MLSLSPSYRWRHWGPGSLNSFPSFTKPGNVVELGFVARSPAPELLRTATLHCFSHSSCLSFALFKACVSKYMASLCSKPTHWEKTLMPRKTESRRRSRWQEEMVGWHYQLNGHEFEQAPGDGEEQESLACCSPWGHKESGDDWATEQQNILWTRTVPPLIFVSFATNLFHFLRCSVKPWFISILYHLLIKTVSPDNLRCYLTQGWLNC